MPCASSPRKERTGSVLSRVEVDEDEAFPHLALDRRHPAAVGVEVQQQILAGGRVQRAVQLVAPAVEAAVQQRRAALHLLERVVLPQHLVAAVRADVVEGADHVVLAPHDDDRGVEEPQLPGEVAARLRHPLDPAHVEPGLLEDVLAFLFVELLGNAVFERHRAAAEFGIRVGPMSACGFGHQAVVTHEALLRAER